MYTSIYNIVSEINESIVQLFKNLKLQNYSVYGIAELETRIEETIPVIDGEFVGIDDKNEVSLYHRLANVTTTIDVSRAVGRSEGMLVNNYSMGAIIFLDRKKTGMYPDTLMQFLQINMPGVLRFPPYERVTVSFANTVLDNRVVHAQEYSAKAGVYRLKDAQYLFRLNYNVAAMYSKKCFELCT